VKRVTYAAVLCGILLGGSAIKKHNSSASRPYFNGSFWPLLIQLQHSYAEKVGAWQQQRMWLTHTPRKPNNRCLNSLCALCAHWKGKGSLGDTCTKTSVGGSPLPIFPISPSCVNANVYEWKNSHWCLALSHCLLNAQCSILECLVVCGRKYCLLVNADKH